MRANIKELHSLLQYSGFVVTFARAKEKLKYVIIFCTGWIVFTSNHHSHCSGLKLTLETAWQQFFSDF